MAFRSAWWPAFVAVALVFAHWSPLAAMVGLWSRSPMYSYAYLVPLISTYFIWQRRAALAELTPAPSLTPGMVLLGGGLSMLAIGHVGSIQVLQQLAFVVNVTAAVLLVGGMTWLRSVGLGLAYLVLMVPVWDGLTGPLHGPFQNLSAAIAVPLLRAWDVPAYRQGVLLNLPSVSIEVARSCSGVNYLFAVLACGIPLAYMGLARTWHRIALVVAAAVIAALSNGVRVALIGLLAHLQIGSPLHGPMHLLHGLFVAAVGFIALLAGLALLQRFEIHRATQSQSVPLSVGSARPRAWRAYAFAVSLCFCAAGIALSVWPSSVVRLREPLDTLPARLGSWQVRPTHWITSDSGRRWSDADMQLRREYRNNEDVVEVFVGYFASQRQSREVASFRTSDLHRLASPVRVSCGGRAAFSANLVRPDARRAWLFWYEVDGRVQTSRVGVQFRTIWNATLAGRTNAAVVVLSTVERPQDAPAVAEQRLRDVASLVCEGLERSLPGRPTGALRAAK